MALVGISTVFLLYVICVYEGCDDALEVWDYDTD